MSAEGGAGDPRVGFVGLGNIGLPMASRLVDAPGGLTVFDLVPATATKLVEQGAALAGSVKDLAGRSDVICVMVQNDEQVRGVLGEVMSSAAPGTTVVVHSTIHPDTAVDAAHLARQGGVHVLDAPVSGGPMGAESGRLALMVGGAEEGFERARPVLERLGDLVVHLGPAGAGTRAKLARNLLHFVSFTAAGEALRLAEAAGIPPEVLGQIVRHSDAVTGGVGAVMWRDTAAPMEEGDGWWSILDHVRVLGEKDLTLAIELGDHLGVPTPMADYALKGLAPALGFPAPGPDHVDDEEQP